MNANTIERKISDVNDAWTERLDQLEQQLPTVPAKALAATRSSVRSANQAVESAASSIKARFEQVGDDASNAVSTATDKAKASVDASAKSVQRGVAEATSQAKAQAARVASSVSEEVEGALDDAEISTDPDALAAWSKAALYERAQELDIEGRSGMTKAELVRAIQQA